MSRTRLSNMRGRAVGAGQIVVTANADLANQAAVAAQLAVEQAGVAIASINVTVGQLAGVAAATQTAANTTTTKAAEAATSATNAATSATNAAGSASTASTKAGEAGTSATNAAGSATAANTKAGEAATSATNAAGSATAANTKAGEAATSATNAHTSELAAAGLAGTAVTQAGNAAASATSAQNWAAQMSGTVDGTSYSAKYYAQAAANSAAAAAGGGITPSGAFVVGHILKAANVAGTSVVDGGLLATVATSGAYGDLSGRPALATVATSGAYGDLSGKPVAPTLAAVATSGAYADLSGRPTIPTNNNQLTNGSAYITAADASITAKESLANKNQANGYAGLDGTGKVATAQLPASVLGDLQYQGGWNASTNSPAIPAPATANKGWYYVVTTAGTTAITGAIDNDWQVGDWLVSNGATGWDKLDNADLVKSVAGLVGPITATALKTALVIVATDITDATTAGKALLTAPNGAAQLTALGVSTFIKTLLDDADGPTALLTLGAFAAAGGTFAGDVNFADFKSQRAYLMDIAEVVNARGSISGAQTIDLELGNVATATITGATQFTFANPAASGRSCTFVLKLTNGGTGAITWPTSVKWANSTSNAAPALTASGRDRLWFTTEDAGATWDGGMAGKGFGL